MLALSQPAAVLSKVDLTSKVFVYMRCRSRACLLSKQVKSAKNKDTASDKQAKGSSGGLSKARGTTGRSYKPVDTEKFQLYFDLRANIDVIKPHQVSLMSSDMSQ